MRTLPALLVPVLLLGPAAPACAAWIFDADVGVVYEDNVTLAEMERDIKSDTALGTSISAGAWTVLGDLNTLSATADVSGNVYSRFSGLNSLALGGTVALRRKLGLGAEAPWVRMAGSAARLDYREDVRDGWRYRVGAGAGKRFGERWNVRADYVYERRMADHEIAIPFAGLPGDVFDQESHTFSLRGEFTYNEVLLIFATYALRLGDVASTTQRNPAIFAASTAVTPDPVFGPEAFAYKIDATVHILSFGLSFALGSHASLNVAYEHQIGLGHGGIDYRDNIVRASFLYSY
jgi:hypothetical protein